MLNAESLRFANMLDAETGAEQSMSMKETVQFNKDMAAAKARAAAPSFWSRTKSVFGWLEGNAGKVLSKGVKTASSLGLAVPLDKDINRLTEMKRELSGLGYQMADITSKAVPRMLARKNASTDLIARNLQTAASQARAQIVAATKALDRAQATAQNAKKAISSGQLPGQYTAIFLVQKKQGDVQYSSAKKRAEAVRLQWQNAEAKLVSSDTPKAMDYVRTAGAVAGEFGGRAAAVAQFAGEETEAIGRAIKSGVPAANAILQYWPYALGAAAVLYIAVSAKSSGAAMGGALGRTVESYKRR